VQYEPERITVEEESVVIEWTDGESTAISGSRLRDACPCADCRERTVATPAIQLGDRAMIINAQLVGGYAVSFTFGDNHHDGIYPYGQLRRLGEASSP
jgi:DUF971 family protein